MPPVRDADLAKGELLGTFAGPLQLLAGESPVVTEDMIVDTGVLAKYTVMGKITATGKLIVLTPAASDGSQIAHSILSQAVDASAADVSVAVFTAGFFNHAALVWPAAIDTLVKRQIAFDGSMIHIGKVSLS